MISFYDKRGGEKKKCKCLPPTQCEINQTHSAGRKKGREEGRKEGSGRALSPPEASALPGNHPSSHIYTQTHLRSSNSARTQRRPKKKEAHAQGCVKRSNLNPSKVTPCAVLTMRRRIALWMRWMSAGASRQGFPNAVF